jgi:hypothetical protein
LKITAAFGSNSSAARRTWRRRRGGGSGECGGGGGEGTAPGVELFMYEPPGAIVSLRKNCESKGYFSDSKVALQKIHILLFFDDFIAHIFFYVLRPKMNFGWYLTFESTFSS